MSCPVTLTNSVAGRTLTAVRMLSGSAANSSSSHGWCVLSAFLTTGSVGTTADITFITGAKCLFFTPSDFTTYSSRTLVRDGSDARVRVRRRRRLRRVAQSHAQARARAQGRARAHLCEREHRCEEDDAGGQVWHELQRPCDHTAAHADAHPEDRHPGTDLVAHRSVHREEVGAVVLKLLDVVWEAVDGRRGAHPLVVVHDNVQPARAQQALQE